MHMLGAMRGEMLFVHLHYAVRVVMGVKEAMWDILAERVRSGDMSLGKFGWDDEDGYAEGGEGLWRERFDILCRRYEQYVRLFPRVSPASYERR